MKPSVIGFSCAARLQTRANVQRKRLDCRNTRCAPNRAVELTTGSQGLAATAHRRRSAFPIGTEMDKVIPLLSLIVAALAVFIGPMISWRIAKRQIASSLDVANKQIIAPMRQAWINNLRDLLAELISSSLHYYVAGYEDRKDEEYQYLTLLEHKVQLMLNPKEEDHQQLEALVRRMIQSIESGKGGTDAFPNIRTELISVSRDILKREWDRVKQPITLSLHSEA
jgi:hypothetical protein